jgi:hypothetical protein
MNFCRGSVRLCRLVDTRCDQAFRGRKVEAAFVRVFCGLQVSRKSWIMCRLLGSLGDTPVLTRRRADNGRLQDERVLVR